MGYFFTPTLIAKNYVPSDDLIHENTATDTTSSTSYVHMSDLDITLVSYINEESRFRFVYQHRYALGTSCYSYIARNGVQVGTTNRSTLAGGAWKTETEDIDIGSWKIGDVLQLWALNETGAGQSQVKNFQIKGVGSEWQH